MKRSAPIYVFAFMLTGCDFKEDGGHQEAACDPQHEACVIIDNPVLADGSIGEVPNEALTFETNLDLVNFNYDQEDKILRAAELIRETVATKDFKEAVINHTYNGKKTFVDNKGLSNLEIYHRILQGAEKLTPKKNNAMDVEVQLYYQASTTIGYTRPDTRRIYMNTKYFNVYSASQVTGNLTHEWLHKLGFEHASTYSVSRPYSVPYAIGYLMQRLTRNLP